ncbi:hypothetical protein FOZ62_007246 [Perkinsus olseni]|uniref:Uncharacterized protein n=1 Tax=Perkinsus olseni TaxID=32597 RepID=A0A7J6SXK6_PEROL|nr:hypothetical protein FOZ62_007246 [Perkinsus olseni]
MLILVLSLVFSCSSLCEIGHQCVGTPSPTRCSFVGPEGLSLSTLVRFRQLRQQCATQEEVASTVEKVCSSSQYVDLSQGTPLDLGRPAFLHLNGRGIPETHAVTALQWCHAFDPHPGMLYATHGRRPCG